MDAISFRPTGSDFPERTTGTARSPALAAVVVEPRLAPAKPAHLFELPRTIFAAMGAAYVVFLASMTAAFGAGSGMPLVLAICAVYLLMYLGTPALLARIAGTRRDAPVFRGIDTPGGRMGASAVLGQVLIVPACVAGFGIAILTIVATL